MSEQSVQKNSVSISVEQILEPLSPSDLNDLCDATDAAIEGGGGFGWLRPPMREGLERYWQGVIAAPTRWLFIADRKSTRLNSSHVKISYAVFCLKKKKHRNIPR